jgi:hypothetical protein
LPDGPFFFAPSPRPATSCDLIFINYICRGGALVGRLADLTDTGVMLMCDEPMAVGTVLDLQIRPETELSAVPAVDVEARCRWCRRADHPGYDIGFEFIDPRLGTARDIGRLINDIGMTDA